MVSSCISHPEREALLIIRAWQIEATGDPCAAALLSFFEYWHGIKLAMRVKALAANATARKHRDEGAAHQDTSVYQFHTAEELSAGIMGLYGKDRIRDAIKKLTDLGFISVHKNPNPKYHFDATRHFIFHVREVTAWLDARNAAKRAAEDARFSDTATDSSTPLAENRTRETENRTAIPETSSETSTGERMKGVLPNTHRVAFAYPKSEIEMAETLTLHAVEYNPDYDGNFFNQMADAGWKIRGERVFDWIAAYRSRLGYIEDSESQW